MPDEEPEFQWLEDVIHMFTSAAVAGVVAVFTTLTNLVCAIFGLSSDAEDDRTNE